MPQTEPNTRGRDIQHRTYNARVAHSLKARIDQKRKFSQRIADTLTRQFGSMWFLIVNLTWFAIWIVINVGLVPGIKPFDQYPFSFLTLIVSLEAIVLAIVVLISQNREEQVATLRQETDLLINTQTEKEMTKLLQLVCMLLKKNGIDVSSDQELQEMLTPTDAEQLEEALEQEIAQE